MLSFYIFQTYFPYTKRPLSIAVSRWLALVISRLPTSSHIAKIDILSE